jgi:hypothetical protein
MGVHETFEEAELRSGKLEAVAQQPDRKPANSTRKNHFVPCFYSSLWTGEDRKLCEFTRPQGRVKPLRKHPAATGYSHDLYTEAALPPELRTYLEDRFLRRVDQRAFDALQLILAGRIDDLTPELRSAWARFLMSMVQRSPAKIAELRNRWRTEYLKPDDAMVQHYQELRTPTDPATLKEYLEQTSPETLGRGQLRLIQMVMNLPKVGHTIINMIWGVLTIPDVPFNFLTSDRPVIMTNGIGKDEGQVAPCRAAKALLGSQEERDDRLDFETATVRSHHGSQHDGRSGCGEVCLRRVRSRHKLRGKASTTCRLNFSASVRDLQTIQKTSHLRKGGHASPLV